MHEVEGAGKKPDFDGVGDQDAEHRNDQPEMTAVAVGHTSQPATQSYQAFMVYKYRRNNHQGVQQCDIQQAGLFANIQRIPLRDVWSRGSLTDESS